MTLLSRVLGLTRDIVIARFFSAGDAADAFFVAFKIPNFLRRLFAEGAFALAFVPVLTEYRTQFSEAQTRDLINRVAGTLGVILLVLTLIGVIASPLLIGVFAAGFIDQPEKFDLTADMLRITFPYILLISMTAMAGGILNTWKHFAVPAFTPVLLNLSMIACAVWLSPLLEVPVTALAWGVFLAGILQLLFQLPFLYREGLLPKPTWGWRHEGVQKIVKLMIPALFGSSVAQINLLFDTFIASFLISGSVAWLYYSDRLLEFPLGVFGIALATVILPNLSRQHAAQSHAQFSATLDWSMRLTMLIALPAALGLFLLAGPLVTTIFFGGQFDAHDVAMSTPSLQAYSVGLTGFIFVKVLAPGFFARQDTRTPVRIGIIALVVNMVLNVLIVVPWVQAGWAAPHAGLAAATSASAFLNAGLLWRELRRQDAWRPTPGWGRFLLQVAVAGGVMGMMLNNFVPPVGAWLETDLLTRCAWLAGAVVGGMGVYVAVLLAVGLRPAALRMTSSGPAL
jgi:putative peptidoglycan lipid II flippase